jgi:hypothetical protein
MKLTTVTQVTVDGVMQGNGGATVRNAGTDSNAAGGPWGRATTRQGRSSPRPAGPDMALDLVDSRVDTMGVTIQVYRPNGRPQYAPTR